MSNIFNPLYSLPPTEIHEILYNIASSTSRKFCFYCDNAGVYSNALRKLDNVQVSYCDGKYYNLYIMLRDDIYLTKTVFDELNKGYDFKLMDYFEKRLHTETNPIIASYILFLLHNMSDYPDGSMGMYDEGNFDRVLEKTKNLDSYFIKNKEIFYNEIPEESFVISVDDNFGDREGLIITNKKMEYDLVRKVGKQSLYYKEK